MCPSSLGAALVWDYETGQLLNVLVDPTESPMLAAASRPGTMDLATTSRDAAVRVWSPQVGNFLACLRLGAHLSATAAHPNRLPTCNHIRRPWSHGAFRRWPTFWRRA